MFQESGIILSEKNFSRLSDHSEFRYRNEVPKAESRNFPLLVIRFREGGLSLFGSHGKGPGPRVSHCDVRVPVEVKNFLSQKNFQLFFKTGFSHVSGLWDNFKPKKFFRLSDQLESRHRNEVPKAETSLNL